MSIFHQHNFQKTDSELWCSCGEIRKLNGHQCTGSISNFKIGDKVRVIAHWTCPTGWIGTVYGLTEGGYYVEYENGATNFVRYCYAFKLKEKIK